jgi:hypothetical protein
MTLTYLSQVSCGQHSVEVFFQQDCTGELAKNYTAGENECVKTGGFPGRSFRVSVVKL